VEHYFSMKVSATELRGNVYRLIDEVIRTGEPIEIERKGKVVKIMREAAGGKLKNLKRRKTYLGKPEDKMHQDWSEEIHIDLP
jgi:hypothetical protein